MPDITSAAADRLHALSNVALIVGAVLALVGTFGTVWMGSIRDTYADIRLRQAEVRVAEANRSAAAANEQAAKSQKDAALANLETEKLKKEVSWRQLTLQQEDDVASSLKGLSLPIEITWIGSDPESGFFAESIRRALAKAGANLKHFQPSLFLGEQPPPGMSIRGPAEAITALSKAFSQSGVQPIASKIFDNPAGVVSIIVGSRTPLATR